LDALQGIKNKQNQQHQQQQHAVLSHLFRKSSGNFLEDIDEGNINRKQHNRIHTCAKSTLTNYLHS